MQCGNDLNGHRLRKYCSIKCAQNFNYHKAKAIYKKALGNKAADVYAENKLHVADIRRHIDELKNAPCKDCGNFFDPVCMDFDHIDASKKIAGVGTMVSWGWDKDSILEEVKKCELVCSNCHRLRTKNRHKAK